MTDRMQAMLARACFDREPSFERDLPAFLARHGVAGEDADVILASPKRLGLYRRLVRHNVTSVIDTMLEHTRKRLDARAPGAFDQMVAGFLHDVGPRTPHMRDVPSEFLAYAAPRWREDARLPRWIADHAELELAEFTIAVAPRAAPPPPLAEVTALRPLVFGEPRRIMRLGSAVNTMDRDEVMAEPEARPVDILVYRDAQHHARFLELTLLASAILERLFAGMPLADALTGACTALAHPLDDAVLGGAARLLADLGDRGLLLGARDLV